MKTGTSSIYEDVTERLTESEARGPVLDLWESVQQVFQDSGPEAVKSLIESRVRSLANTAKKDLTTSRAVARSMTPVKRKSSAAPVRAKLAKRT
jgi:hypothetical protein